MPELPEVETIRRALSKALRGTSITSCRILTPGVVSFLSEDGPPSFPLRIQRFARKGKFLCLTFEGDQHLLVHLRMTGGFYFRKETENRHPHTHVEFVLGTGEILSYRDPRRFGRHWWVKGLDPFSIPPVSSIGPDALEIDLEEFTSRISSHRRMIKPLLLDQRVVSGLGNIYVDETLHRARIHPKTLSHRIRKKRLGELWASMRETLEAAIKAGGSSIRNYVSSDGLAGTFQVRHRVYDREGQPCLVCGKAIRRIIVAQRGTWYCQRCQRYRSPRV